MIRPAKSYKPWKRRAYTLAIYATLLISALTIILLVFQDNVVFYYSPKDLFDPKFKQSDSLIRIGGLVKSGSIRKSPTELITTFIITDFEREINVSYQGILPALFKEEQGTVVLGRLSESGVFVAVEVLAKHDENYIPKEVVETLKQSGYWKE